MTFELIAHFYEKSSDSRALYRVPIGLISYETHEEIALAGFHEDPSSTPGYTDYLMEVNELELQNLVTDENSIPELLDVLDCGTDYEKIIVHAYEPDFFAGELPPRAIYVGDISVTFTGIAGNAAVVFRTRTDSFHVPLSNLKTRLGVRTMFEALDIVKTQLETIYPIDTEPLPESEMGQNAHLRLAKGDEY